LKIYDFNNPEDFAKLEKQAYDGTININDFPPAAYRYFDKLRALYYEFKFKGLPKERAVKIKDKLLSDYKEANRAYNDWCDDHKERQECIRIASTLLSDIEKEQDIKAAAFIAFEIIGRYTGDENFIKRQRKKWEE
jgi:hypothetical protein